MRRSWLLSMLSCVMLALVNTGARAAVFNMTFDYGDGGEAEYYFSGSFDTDVPGSGTGTLQFVPIESTSPPFEKKLTSLDVDLTDMELYGSPAYSLSMSNFPYDIPVFPIYFFNTSTGIVFDAMDSPALFTATLELAGSLAVPLPSSAPLFGAAVLALGGLGCGMKRLSRPQPVVP